MTRFFVFLGLLISVTGQAATNQYLIKSQLYINGKLISSPTISTLANEPAEITQVRENPHEELKFKVVASEKSTIDLKDGILMKLDLEYSAGTDLIKSSPQILTKAGSESTIFVGTGSGNEDILLKVTATRQ